MRKVNFTQTLVLLLITVFFSVMTCGCASTRPTKMADGSTPSPELQVAIDNLCIAVENPGRERIMSCFVSGGERYVKLWTQGRAGRPPKKMIQRRLIPQSIYYAAEDRVIVKFKLVISNKNISRISNINFEMIKQNGKWLAIG